MNASIRPWLGRHVASALALFFLLAGMAHASAPAPEPRRAEYEIGFLTGMVDHHAMAVQMASICQTKAVHAELAELCTDMRTAQQSEIVQMQAWLQGWYGVMHEPVMKPSDMQQMEKMAALSGAAFEIEFMDMMTRHHLVALREAAGCLWRAYHGELTDLCEGMIEDQLLEIQAMQLWLCQWYGRCKPGREPSGAVRYPHQMSRP